MYLHNFEGHCCAVNDIRMDDFAREYPLLDDVGVHAQWQKGSWQITRIADIWTRTGKVLSLPYKGANAYPSFQFAQDGTPLPLMEKVLKALPREMTPWQCAFWLTSPKLEIGGESPANRIQIGDDCIVGIASDAGGLMAA